MLRSEPVAGDQAMTLPRLDAEQRRALRLLAGTPLGNTESTMIVDGFKRKIWRAPFAPDL